MTAELQLFLDPVVLTRMGRPLLGKLFSRFIHVLPHQHSLPDPKPDNDCYFDALVSVLERPDDLPDTVLEALAEIELIATRDHGPYLPLNEEMDAGSDCARLRRAIETWLATAAHAAPAATVGAPALAAAAPVSHPSPAARPSTVPVRTAPSTPHSATAPMKAPLTPSTHESAFAALARLSTLEYDAVRKAEARRLHLRLAILDAEVERARPLEYDTEANTVTFPKLTPWPEPIADAPALFDEVLARFVRHLHAPPGAHEVFTLWDGHAHALRAFRLTPRLYLTSDEPGCGKSTAINLLASLAPKALLSQNMSPAVLFRVIDQHQPTVFLDEIETYLSVYKELRGLLNAGIQVGASVYRCEGQTARAFKAFAPTVFAGLGDLPATLRDRSIRFHLAKAPPGLNLARFEASDADPKKEIKDILNRKLARWSADNLDAIAACEPLLPPGAHNRLADLWRPLFAIAQVVGGDWPARATEAFERTAGERGKVALHGVASAGNGENGGFPGNGDRARLNAQLVADIPVIFAESGVRRLFSRDIVAGLCAVPDRPWRRLCGSQAKPERWLAEQLGLCGIRARTLRIGGTVGRGYVEDDFRPPADACFDPGI